jgi:hypothetical protein
LNRHRKVDLLAAVFIMLGWLGLLFWAGHRMCNNHCSTDQHCRDMCRKRNDCPNWDRP